MTKEEHETLLQSLKENIDDKDKIIDIIDNLKTDYVEQLNQIENLTKENTETKTKNNELLEQNMKLFLRVGATKKEAEQTKEENNLTFESLFDTNGELIKE